MRKFWPGIALLPAFLAVWTSHDVIAQDARKVWRVGILWHASNLQEEEVMFRPLVEGLQALGYIEGKNLVFDHTFVDENFSRFQARATELVERKADLILASVYPAAAAANRVTKTVPIVFAASGDPTKFGIVESLRRPGGNLTGFSLFLSELATKQVEILRDVFPSMSHLGVIWNPANPDHSDALQEAERAAKAFKLQMTSAAVKSPDGLPEVFTTLEKAKVNAMIVFADSMLRVNHKPIVAFAAAKRLPTIFAAPDFVEAGGLVAYGACIPCNFRRSATYIDKIFKGGSPGDLPIELPATFSLQINLKTAKALGVTVPPSILLRADTVIE